MNIIMDEDVIDYDEITRVIDSSLSQTDWRLRTSSRRRLQTDILALCTGMRPVIMIDYGGKLPELRERLCLFLKFSQEGSTIFRNLRVMVIEDMIYLIHVKGLAELIKSTINKEIELHFVDIEQDPPKMVTEIEQSLVGAQFISLQKLFSSVFCVDATTDDVSECTEDSTSNPESSHSWLSVTTPSSDLIDLSHLMQDTIVTVPTLNGWLLGYPVVYIFGKDHIDEAVYNLSTKSLNLFNVYVRRNMNSSKRPPQEELMSFSVPYDLSIDGDTETWAEAFLVRMKAKREGCKHIWGSLRMEVSATSMGEISSLLDEIIHNIIVRLPLNLLVKLKYVCKRWNRLLSDPYYRPRVDILALCTGMRPVIMIDYGGKLPELRERLCLFLKFSQEGSTIFRNLRVMVIEDMIYLIHVKGLAELIKSTVNKEIELHFVDIEQDPPKMVTEIEQSLVGAQFISLQKLFLSVFCVDATTDDVSECTEDSTSNPESSHSWLSVTTPSSDLIDLSHLMQDTIVTVPTLNGWLLGYPVVYSFGKDHIDEAVYNLSTKSLNLFNVYVRRNMNSSKRPPQEELMSFSVPYDLSIDGASETWAEAFLVRMKAKWEGCKHIWGSLRMEVSATYPQAIAL